MFRDSRGVVHTVSSSDPLSDLPPGAARALQDALLAPPGPGGSVDVGSVLTLAEQVRDLLGRWQDAFFESLPREVDLAEEARWAQEAGLSLESLEAETADADLDLDLDDDDLEEVELDDDGHDGDPLTADLRWPLGGGTPGDDPRDALPEPLLTALERELLLLPVRVRLEALVAADDLVQEWSELVADREKLLGHLALAHGDLSRLAGEAGGGAPDGRSGTALDHEALAVRHAELHAVTGPGHPAAGP